ncbi:MAG: class II glutamine amidotransferase [Rubrobacteraceae bacterium]
MCRLFGLSGGSERVHATFWLLEAPDSLARQSRQEPDGVGLGYFEPDGSPRVLRDPIAAYEDASFSHAAREEESSTFVAHVRYASTGDLSTRNTHPFEQGGRLFAHNGVIQDLGRLEGRLGGYLDLVQGETDSERYFALITKEIEASSGDVGRGIVSAARWIAAELSVFSLNLVLTTPEGLWALRYPETHPLFFLERAAGGPHEVRHLDHASAAGTVRVRSEELRALPAVVVATERMDEDPGWRPLESGSLLHVGPDLSCTVTTVIDSEPAKRLTLADLEGRAAASQS